MTLAIVLAGSLNDARLKGCSDATNEALIKIGNKCMVEYVVEALKDSRKIERIIIVGPQTELEKLFKSDEIYIVEGGKTIIQSLLKALDYIGEIEVSHVLVVTSDIPLITGKIIDDFLEKGLREKADVIYPIVDKTLNESRFPGVKRTYVKLKEGTYTGGNMFLVNPAIIKPCSKDAEEIVGLRKSPIRLANYIGIIYILKYLLGILSVKDAEKRVSELFNISGKAIPVPYPEIGIDVDKPSDLELVEKVLVNSHR